jgi:hypothetical protein
MPLIFHRRTIHHFRTLERLDKLTGVKSLKYIVKSPLQKKGKKANVPRTLGRASTFLVSIKDMKQ